MNRGNLLQYEQTSVRLSYKIMTGDRMCPHTRSGVIYSVTEEVVVFWPLNVSKKTELRIPFEDIKKVELI